MLNYFALAYMKNLQTWSTTATPPPKNSAAAARSTRARNTRSTLAGTPTPYTPPVYQAPLPAVPLPPPVPPVAPNPPRPPLPTSLQALQSTYASRLRTGATLLMQPIIASTSTAGARTAIRRGGVVNYADPGSGDELPDAGALDSDDSEFVASGGTRTSVRQGRNRQSAGMSVFNSTTGATTAQPLPAKTEKTELDQSYLGMVPPAKFIKQRWIHPTAHVYPYVLTSLISSVVYSNSYLGRTQDMMEQHAENKSSLVPIRVEFETETHRVRDCFVWNLNEALIKPETFAKTFCADLDLPLSPWVDTIANQIRAQLEEFEGVASMNLEIGRAHV